MKSENKKIVTGIMFSVIISNMFAQDLKSALRVDQLQSMIKSIIDILNGPIASIILGLLIVVIGYIMIVNQDNQQVKKKAIAALVGIALIKGATMLADWFVGT